MLVSVECPEAFAEQFADAIAAVRSRDDIRANALDTWIKADCVI